MSTKFAVRPAVRKRPWICKRSPPCLIQPPIPLTFIASYYVEPIRTNPESQIISGTIVLYRQPLGEYFGRWDDVAPSSNKFVCTFVYTPQPAIAYVHFQVGMTVETGTCPPRDTLPSPKTDYLAFEAAGLLQPWIFRLKITG